MPLHYAFNGDADGLCALQQLRLARPNVTATLKTGTKRDVSLLSSIEAQEGDEVTCLNISLEQNRDAVWRLLQRGVLVRYFDHHRRGEALSHCFFEQYIDEKPDVCTSSIVDAYLRGTARRWAAVGALGDSLREFGNNLARATGLDLPSIQLLERLRVYLNYNAYGDFLEDLHFHPAHLAEHMHEYQNPLEFVDSHIFVKLHACYEEDMEHVRQFMAIARDDRNVLVLPNTTWARRTRGLIANQLSTASDNSAFAVLSADGMGNYVVSVRVPAASPITAGQFCREFATGGGRHLSAGINRLSVSELETYLSHDSTPALQMELVQQYDDRLIYATAA